MLKASAGAVINEDFDKFSGMISEAVTRAINPVLRLCKLRHFHPEIEKISTF